MFTQRLSMNCTKEQYEKYLKEELLKMGYKEQDFEWNDEDSAIVTYWLEINDAITTFYKYNLGEGRTYLGSFNAPLFLALAAMTDNAEGGYREYYVKDNEFYSMKESGFLGANGFFRKATKEEIMAKFGGEIWNQNKSTDAVDAISYSVGRMPKDNRIYKLNEKGQIEINVLFGATETTEIDAINLLKSKGYKILKPKTWEEV